MKRKHLATLRQIFSRPVSGTIRWADIEALFLALGAEVNEREGSRVGVFLFDEVRVFHRPHPSPETDRGAVAQWRAFANGWKAMVLPMNNLIEIDGHKAVVSLDPEIGLLRGEFLGLNGGADFYADSIENLRKEGAISLKVFLDMCAEKGIAPRRSFSGRFNVRLSPAAHEAAVLAAKAADKSLNEWVSDVIEDAASGQ